MECLYCRCYWAWKINLPLHSSISSKSQRRILIRAVTDVSWDSAVYTWESDVPLSLSHSSFPFLLLLLLRETLTRSNSIPKQHLQVLSTNPISLILPRLQVMLNLNDSWTRGSTVSNSGSLTVLLYYSAPYFPFNTCSFASLRKCKSKKTDPFRSCCIFILFFSE